MPKSLSDRLADLDAEHEKKRAEIINDDRFLSLLPTWADEYYHGSPHWHKLYGHEVSISWSPVRYSSISEGKKSPDLEFVARLMAEYSPLPCVMVKDGCTSFRLASAAPTDDERCNVTPVAPFIIRLELDRDRTAAFEWCAKIGDFVCQFAVSIPVPQKLGKIDVRVKEDRYGGRHVERAEFDPLPAGARRIKWASGGSQYVNQFTVFWESPDYTLAELLESLK